MVGYQYHLFVCENERAGDHPRGCCAKKGGKDIRSFFKKEITKAGLNEVARSNMAGCLDYCEQGPVMVIYPDNIWYTVKNLDDAKRIMDSHIKNGIPVSDLQLKLTS